jgi:hypothetical protein
MNLNLVDEGGATFVEGRPGEALMARVGDVNRVIEACWEQDAKAALLYAANMTPSFFDLSSGDAGEILQKLRNYRIRLAVVYEPGEVTLSSRFGEMVDDERRGPHFGLFESRQDAVDWIRQS